MTRTFDTRAHLPQRTLIRRGVISLLSQLKRSNGGYLIDVVPFGAVVRSYTDIDGVAMLIETLKGRTPSIAVGLGDAAGSINDIGGFQADKEIQVCLYHCSAHGRNLLVGRHEQDVNADISDTVDPGLDVMMEHAEELVIGQYCGIVPPIPSIKQARIDREEELHTMAPLTIWLQTFRVPVKRDINQFRNVTQILQSIAWRLAIDPAEVPPPDPKVDELSLDSTTELTELT